MEHHARSSEGTPPLGVSTAGSSGGRTAMMMAAAGGAQRSCAALSGGRQQADGNLVALRPPPHRAVFEVIGSMLTSADEAAFEEQQELSQAVQEVRLLCAPINNVTYTARTLLRQPGSRGGGGGFISVVSA